MISRRKSRSFGHFCINLFTQVCISLIVVLMIPVNVESANGNESTTGENSLLPLPHFEALLSLLDSYNGKNFDIVILGLKEEDVKKLELIKSPKLQISLEFNAERSVCWQNQSLEDVFSSSIYQQPRIHSTMVLLYPEDLLHVSEFINQVSGFYSANPSMITSFYFFVVWRHDFEQTPSTVQSLLNSWNPFIPIESHLNIMLEPRRSVVEIWEYYFVKDVPVFQQVASENFVSSIARRSDFRGVTIKGIIQKELALSFLASHELVNGSYAYTGGLIISLFEAMAKLMNFTTEYIDGTGWITIENGTVQGIGKQLVDHTGDVAISLSEILHKRYKTLEIVGSQPVTTFGVHAFFRKPEPNTYRNVLREAFKPDLWGAVAATWIVLALSLVFFKYVKFKFGSSLTPQDEEATSDFVLSMIAACCQIGWHCVPSSPSLQAISIVALTSSLLYYTAYSASIVSIFSVDINRFQSLNDLYQHGFTLYGNSFSEVGLWEVEERAKLDGVPYNSRLLSPGEALGIIKSSKSAYLSSRTLFIRLAVSETSNAEAEECSYITRTTHPESLQHMGFYSRKFDPIKTFLGVQLAKHRERGLLFRFSLQYDLFGIPECDQESKKKNVSLTLHDVRSAFMSLGLGYMSCLIILLIEILSYASRNRIGVRATKYCNDGVAD